MRRNAAANRERILAAAEDVFGTYGVVGSTEDVARRAEVGIATVFRNFPTKADLLEAVLARHFDQLIEQADGYADAADPVVALQDVVRTLIRTGSTKLFLAGQLPGGDFPASVAQRGATLRARVAQLIERAIDAGGVRPDVTVDEVYLLIHALAQVGATRPAPAETVDRAVDVVLAGLRS